MSRRVQVMNTVTKFVVLLAMAGVMALAPVTRANASDTNARRLEETRLAIEKSSLTREEKTGILSKVDKAVAAGVPAEDVAIIVNRGFKQGIPSVQMENYLETMTAVKAQNLPVRLVLERIQLGLAKGVPADRIAAATMKLSGNLATARPLVDKVERGGLKNDRGGNSDFAVETVARALEKAIPPDDIVRTGEKVREQKGSIILFDRAIDTMTMFVGNGMKADNASRLVHKAIDRGYTEQDLEVMERYMAGQLRSNRAMNDVVSGMESGMERGTMRDMHGPQGGGMMSPGSGGMGGGGSTMKGQGGMMH